MLKLRKVDLLGFKSFCEKTHITFSGTGVTCIVGPNGCGKSNIVDAVSWVLGEQSHKLLRAERMSDCIFNGTARRPPLGLAEVSLTRALDGTLVRWSVTGHNSFIGRIACLFMNMDKIVGDEFEKGLDKLKLFTEGK